MRQRRYRRRGRGIPRRQSHRHGPVQRTRQSAEPRTRGTTADTGCTAARPGGDRRAPGRVAGHPGPTAPADATAVSYGNYLVPLGGTGNATLTCSFNGNPADEGFAWACQAPVHLGWEATDGGEANSVAYRPGADPEVYALLGNSGVTATDTLAAGTSTPVGDRYTVDTTGDGTTVTDNSTGVAVRMADGGYSRL